MWHKAFGLFLILAFLGANPALNLADDERLDFDPVIQGIWKLHLTSDDKGKTLKKHDGDTFCKVSATKVKMIGGDELVAETIKIIDIDGHPGNVVTFKNGTIWAISKEPGQKYVLVQVFTNADGEYTETFRFLVTVVE